MTKINFEELSPRSQKILERDIETFFLEPADDDYLTARLLWNYDRLRAFGWSAAQALEKYTKAALLLNGRQAKFSHKFATVGYPRLKGISGTLLAKEISIPMNSPFNGHECRSDRDVETSLLRFEKNGSPQSRYGEHGFKFESYDLHLFDSLCFMLRRLCINLNHVSEGETWRDKLKGEPGLQYEYHFHPICRPRIPNELDLEAHLLNGNFEFDKNPKCFEAVSRTAFRIDGVKPYSSDLDRAAHMARQYLMENSPTKFRPAKA